MRKVPSGGGAYSPPGRVTAALTNKRGSQGPSPDAAAPPSARRPPQALVLFKARDIRDTVKANDIHQNKRHQHLSISPTWRAVTASRQVGKKTSSPQHLKNQKIPSTGGCRAETRGNFPLDRGRTVIQHVFSFGW